MEDEIHEEVCVEIIAGLGKGKKQEHVNKIRKTRRLSNEEMKKVREKCSNLLFVNFI